MNSGAGPSQFPAAGNSSFAPPAGGVFYIGRQLLCRVAARIRDLYVAPVPIIFASE